MEFIFMPNINIVLHDIRVENIIRKQIYEEEKKLNIYGMKSVGNGLDKKVAICQNISIQCCVAKLCSQNIQKEWKKE